MLIEFELPKGDVVAYRVLKQLKHELLLWSDRYHIKMTQKTVKYIHRVCFDQDDHYSLFAVTWRGPEFRVIKNRNFQP